MLQLSHQPDGDQAVQTAILIPGCHEVVGFRFSRSLAAERLQAKKQDHAEQQTQPTINLVLGLAAKVNTATGQLHVNVKCSKATISLPLNAPSDVNVQMSSLDLSLRIQHKMHGDDTGADFYTIMPTVGLWPEDPECQDMDRIVKHVPAALPCQDPKYEHQAAFRAGHHRQQLPATIIQAASFSPAWRDEFTADVNITHDLYAIAASGKELVNTLRVPDFVVKAGIPGFLRHGTSGCIFQVSCQAAITIWELTLRRKLAVGLNWFSCFRPPSAAKILRKTVNELSYDTMASRCLLRDEALRINIAPTEALLGCQAHHGHVASI